MATIFTHPAVALALSPWFHSARQSKVVLLVGAILTIVPDIDVVGFKFGISYLHLFGHRGISHSLFFSVVLSWVASWLIFRHTRKFSFQIWTYLFLCTASHGVLDALTYGGQGVAFFAPFSNERYFFRYTPIEVSTLNITRFFQGQGVLVIKSELVWIWIPSIIAFISGLCGIKLLTRRQR